MLLCSPKSVENKEKGKNRFSCVCLHRRKGREEEKKTEEQAIRKSILCR